MVEETSHEGSNEERVSDPALESVHKEMVRYIKRGIALMVAGLMMPVIVGVGASVFTAVFVTTPSGMDGYWPLLVGAFWGAFVGLGLLFAGVGQFLKARRCKRVVSRLTD